VSWHVALVGDDLSLHRRRKQVSSYRAIKLSRVKHISSTCGTKVSSSRVDDGETLREVREGACELREEAGSARSFGEENSKRSRRLDSPCAIMYCEP